MCLKQHKNDKFGIEISGYLANLQVMESPGGKSEICFISGDYDCLNIGEIIKASGYDPKSILNRRLLITIEDEIQPKDTADGKKQCVCSDLGYSKYCPIHGYVG